MMLLFYCLGPLAQHERQHGQHGQQRQWKLPEGPRQQQLPGWQQQQFPGKNIQEKFREF